APLSRVWVKERKPYYRAGSVPGLTRGAGATHEPRCPGRKWRARARGLSALAHTRPGTAIPPAPHDRRSPPPRARAGASRAACPRSEGPPGRSRKSDGVPARVPGRSRRSSACREAQRPRGNTDRLPRRRRCRDESIAPAPPCLLRGPGDGLHFASRALERYLARKGHERREVRERNVSERLEDLLVVPA